MNAYRCNESRFSALVNELDHKGNLRRSFVTPDNMAKALAHLDAEPLHMGQFDAIIVHVDGPTSIKPEIRKRGVKEYAGIGKVQTIPKQKPEVSNAKFAHDDKTFAAACAKAGISPTARQASKWRRKIGLAWMNR